MTKPKKYATLLLGLAIVLASIAAAQAGEGDYSCGDVLISVRQPEPADKNTTIYTFEVSYLIKQGNYRRPIRTPSFVFDPKTRRMTMNGKPCQEGE